MEDTNKEVNEFEMLEDVNVSEERENLPQGNEGEDNMIEQGSGGKVFDFSNVSNYSKAPARIDMDGEIVGIIKAEVFYPDLNSGNLRLNKTKDLQYEYIDCTFKVSYDSKEHPGQVEYYSGVKMFKNKNTGKFSAPSIHSAGKTQSAKLLNLYATHLGKKPNEVYLKDLVTGFNSGLLKAKLQNKEFENPDTEEITHKNIIVKFL